MDSTFLLLLILTVITFSHIPLVILPAIKATTPFFFPGCKVQGINPQQWLEDTLQKIPDHNIQKLEELLPGYQKG